MEFNHYLGKIKNYEPGKPVELLAREFGIKDVIKLASNENPFGCSKKAKNIIKKYAKNANLYPDDSMFELKNKICEKYKIKSENLIIGSGSDQIIEIATRAKLNEKNGILVAKTTFSMYEIYASHVGAKIFKTESQEHNLAEFMKLYKEYSDEIAIIFLCVPNNPLGECLNSDKIYDFLEKIDENTLVVIDGAYQEFAKYFDAKKAISPKKLIEKFPNVLYLGTFSKIYGLGGMRVGYDISSSNIISSLSKLRAPFNVTTLSLKAASVSLDDEKFIAKTLANNAKEMMKFEKFATKNRIKFIKSYANFITFIFDHINSTQISQNLLKKGIILRDLASYNMNALRITIGKPKDNDKVLKELKKIIK